MESGTLADVFPDWIRDRASLRPKAFWNASSCQAPSLRWKGWDLSGRGNQPDIGAAFATSARCGETCDFLRSADHSGPDSRNEGMDLLIGTGGEKTADAKGDASDRGGDLGGLEDRAYE